MADDDDAPETRLPDDIEQKLIDGQRLRATYDLATRRGIGMGEAKTVVGRWLAERPNRNGLVP
jgi:hypothetical protein